jgi:hypothetical protein
MQAFLESPMARMNCYFEFKIKDFNHLKQMMLRFLGFSLMTGCCPNENLFERSLNFVHKSWQAERKAIPTG